MEIKRCKGLIWQIFFIVYGVFHLIVFGILGIGASWGRSKWIYDRFGSTVAKVIQIIIGVIIVILGALWYFGYIWSG